MSDSNVYFTAEKADSMLAEGITFVMIIATSTMAIVGDISRQYQEWMC